MKTRAEYRLRKLRKVYNNLPKPEDPSSHYYKITLKKLIDDWDRQKSVIGALKNMKCVFAVLDVKADKAFRSDVSRRGYYGVGPQNRNLFVWRKYRIFDSTDIHTLDTWCRLYIKHGKHYTRAMMEFDKAEYKRCAKLCMKRSQKTIDSAHELFRTMIDTLDDWIELELYVSKVVINNFIESLNYMQEVVSEKNSGYPGRDDRLKKEFSEAIKRLENFRDYLEKTPKSDDVLREQLMGIRCRIKMLKHQYGKYMIDATMSTPRFVAWHQFRTAKLRSKALSIKEINYSQYIK